MFKGEKNMQTELDHDILFEKRLKEHAKAKRELFASYISQQKGVKDYALTSFTKWQAFKKDKHYDIYQQLFMENEHDLQEGGYFLELNGQGIVINPGKDFLSSFCQKGYSLQDIDAIIVTYSDQVITNQVIEIQEVSQKSNQKLIEHGEDAHIICYFLHRDTFGPVVSSFRPSFKKERESLFLLETFSEKEESISLSTDIELAFLSLETGSLAIRLSIPKRARHIGFISHGGYTRELSDFFKPCTLLVAGIGSTSIEDFEQVCLEKNSLGFFGIITLIETLPNIQLLLVSEFSRAFGDIRIELLQKMQRLLENVNLLPLDEGFSLDLDQEAAQVANGSFCLLKDVRAVRPFGSFSKLLYVASEDLI